MPNKHYPYDAQHIKEDNIGFLVRQLTNSLNRLMEQEMAALNLTAMQWRPLALLALNVASTPAELAKLMGVDTGAITRTLDRLEAKGLVQRVRNQTDRRVVDIQLTELGLSKAKQLPDPVAQVLNHHLDDFAPEEVQQLKIFLERMIKNGNKFYTPLSAPSH